MIVKQLLKLSDFQIDQVSFSSLDKDNMKRDCRHLLSALIPCSFSELFLFYSKKIEEKNNNTFNKQFTDLLTGKPLAYILEKQHFYKSIFFVDNRVLIPRMETELLVEFVFKYFSKKENLLFADFGTGSGCIVLSLLKEFINSKAMAVDSSEKALDVAKYNAEKLVLNSRITFHHSSVENFTDLALLAPLKENFDFIVANPPYIAKKAYVHPFVNTFEPSFALWANDQGLQFSLSWASKALVLLKPGGYYFFEFGDDQKNALKDKLNLLFSEVSFFKDLQGIYRIAICKK